MIQLRQHVLKIVVGILVLGALIFFLRSLSPSRQVASRQETLQRCVEAARWEKLEAMLHPEFSDSWGLGKERGLEALQQLRGQFILLDITSTEKDAAPSISIQKEQATVTSSLRLGGSGSAFIKEIVKRADAVADPYTFIWEKTGRGKSGWLLKAVSNPSLDLDYGQLP